MTLGEFLEVSFGQIEIREYHFDEYGHVTAIMPLFRGYTFEALTTPLPLNNKVNIIVTLDNDIIFVGIYNAEDTEKIKF